MWTNEELERQLAAAPTRQLSDAAHEEIVSAIRATERGPRIPWWARRVALWQAAAACLLIGLAAYAVASRRAASVMSAAPAPGTVAVFVEVDPVELGLRPRPTYGIDIRGWGKNVAEVHGASSAPVGMW